MYGFQDLSFETQRIDLKGKRKIYAHRRPPFRLSELPGGPAVLAIRCRQRIAKSKADIIRPCLFPIQVSNAHLRGCKKSRVVAQLPRTHSTARLQEIVPLFVLAQFAKRP